MKKQRDNFGIFLAAVSGIAFLLALLVRVFFPRVILPRLDAATVVALSLLALLLDLYIAKGSRRNYWLTALYGALIFGLFPLAAGFSSPVDACFAALLGGLAVPVVTFLFDMMLERLTSGPQAKLAPIACAFGLYLAAQCLMGIC